MKPEKLYELIGNIDAGLLLRADRARKNKRKAIIIRAVSAVACLVLVVSAVTVYFRTRPIDDEIGYIENEPTEEIPDGSTDKGSADNNSDPSAPKDNNNSMPPEDNNTSAGSSQQPTSPTEPQKDNQSQPTVFPVVSPIAKILGTAVYPTMPTHYAVNKLEGEEKAAAKQALKSYLDGISALPTDNAGNADFVKKTLGSLTDSAKKDNFVYSPSTLYFALSMLAETADGNTRDELLDLLGKSSVEDLRENNSKLWQKFYFNNGVTTSVQANSVWLSGGTEYNQQTIDILKNKYYASTFAGDFKTQEYSQAMRNWLNEQTGGLLADNIQKKSFSPDTAMSVMSTLFFKAQWHTKFGEKLVKKGTFHGVNGDVNCDFMRAFVASDAFYKSDSFSAIKKGLYESGNVTFILPDEDKTVNDVLKDSVFYNFISDSNTSKGVTTYDESKINVSIPKFDIEADLDLTESLKAIGINDAFNSKTADFSNISTHLPLWLDKVNQATRVKIDEEGCVGTSYVDEYMITGVVTSKNEFDFTLDRPFIFVVTGVDDLPRFIGVVNQP